MSRKSNVVRGGADDLDIPRLEPELLKKGVMGKYYARMMAGSNVVRIAPDLADEFPNEVAVNQGLRDLLQLRKALANIGSGRRRKTA